MGVHLEMVKIKTLTIKTVEGSMDQLWVVAKMADGRTQTFQTDRIRLDLGGLQVAVTHPTNPNTGMHYVNHIGDIKALYNKVEVFYKTAFGGCGWLSGKTVKIKAEAG